DPAKIVMGTALLAGVVSLDGGDSTTFIITTSAMLPLYLRLGISSVVLTLVAGLINGTMNLLPWSGPTVRAAAALGLDPAEVFVPMVPSLVVGVIVVFAFAWFLGISERKRLGGSVDASRFNGDDLRGGSKTDGVSATGGSSTGRSGDGQPHDIQSDGSGADIAVDVRDEDEADVSLIAIDEDEHDGLSDTMLDPHLSTLPPKLIWFNLVLTVVCIVTLVADILPLAFVFMGRSGLALAVNFPKVK